MYAYEGIPSGREDYPWKCRHCGHLYKMIPSESLIQERPDVKKLCPSCFITLLGTGRLPEAS